MKTFVIPQRELRAAYEADVVVCGGGTAGVFAAISAAESGKRVLIVEQFGSLGGSATNGLVTPLMHSHITDDPACSYISIRLREKLKAYGGVDVTGRAFDPTVLMVALEELCAEAGVQLLYHTFISDVLVENGTVKAIVAANKSGTVVIAGDIFIDCTGDGDIAVRAGAPYTMGRASDGACQPMTLMYKISHMDYVQRYPNPLGKKTELFHIMKAGAEAAGLHDYDFNFDQPCLLKLPGLHTGVMQMTHMRGYNGTDPLDLSKAEMEGRERVWEAIHFLKTYCDAFKNVQLDQTAAMIGVRETRRIRGEYEISFADMQAGRRFPDGFATCAFGVDIHQPTGKSQENDIPPIRPYQLPYRSLVPLQVENLLVAGRCISGCFEAHASYRVTGDCVAMGQAAGTAAAMALQKKVSPREMDGAEVARAMERDGARL